MKRKMIYLLMAVIFMMGINVEAQAQRAQGNKKYWKQVEKAEKERAKYISKQNKEKNKYIRKLYKQGPPPWARAHGYNNRHHVYFADYHTFYDPYRGGYVYLDGGNWSFSAQIPSFMVNVNLGNVRVRVLNSIPVTRRPEVFYYDYERGYWD